MTDLMEPLIEAEMEELGRFLLERLEEEDTESGKDEGIFEITGLDGFFTAIVSGPEAIPMSRWLPAVWGDFEPAFSSKKALTHIMNLLIRHMNGIAHYLTACPEEFEPLFEEHLDLDGEQHWVVDEWCEGYLRGVGLTPKWEDGGKEIAALLEPLRAFTEAAHFWGHFGSHDVPTLQQAIAPNVRKIHAYWLARRDHYESHSAPEPKAKVGRNDPCPCGSGKKYKRCCLQ